MTRYNSKNIIIFDDSRAMLLPSGTTAERPSVALSGMIRWNETEEYFEGHDGTDWFEIRGSVSGTPNYVPKFNVTGDGIDDSNIINLVDDIVEFFDVDLQIDADKYFYIGKEDQNLSWRFHISGTDLVFEQRIAGVWTIIETISGS